MFGVPLFQRVMQPLRLRVKRRATADDLWRYAKTCRVANVMRPYLEAIE